MNARLCVVCGARVRAINPRCVTCSPECTRARLAGRTREEEIRREMDIEIRLSAQGALNIDTQTGRVLPQPLPE